MAVVPVRPHAADEAQPQLSALRRGGDDLHQADLPGGAGVRAAAGHHLEVAHGHDAHVLLHRGLFAQRKRSQLLRVREPAADGRVHLDALVYVVLDLRDQLRAHVGRAVGKLHVDAGDLRAQVQADGHAAGQLVHRPGDHVLAAVLLHVIPAPRPVDAPVHHFAHAQRRVHLVPDLALRVHEHVRDARVVDRAGVVGLTAGGGIERGSVQRNDVFAVSQLRAHDLRVKFGQIGIVVIESLSHVVSRSNVIIAENVEKHKCLRCIRAHVLSFSDFLDNPGRAPYNGSNKWICDDGKSSRFRCAQEKSAAG